MSAPFDMSRPPLVGPVLVAGPLAAAVIAAIRAENPGVQVIDRGAYLRVCAPGLCRVSRAEIERSAGAPFQLPADLEAIMPSFAGCFQVTEAEARWTADQENGDFPGPPHPPEPAGPTTTARSSRGLFQASGGRLRRNLVSPETLESD